MRDELVASYAMSTTEATRFLSSIQDMLVPMGVARGQAADMGGEIVRLAADLGSFNNMPTEEVMRGIQSALAGQIEPMRRYGVFLTQNRIKQEALNMGLVEAGEELTQVAKAQATLAIITQDSGDAIGDMARTADSWANTMKKFRAFGEDVKVLVGQELMEAFRPFLDAMRELISTEAGMDRVKLVIETVVDVFKFLARVYKFQLNLFLLFGRVVVDVFTNLVRLVREFGDIWKAVMSGDFAEAGEIIRERWGETMDDLKDQARRMVDDVKAIWEAGVDIFTKNEKDKTKVVKDETNKRTDASREGAAARLTIAEEETLAAIQYTADLLDAIREAAGTRFRGAKATAQSVAALEGFIAMAKAMSVTWPLNLVAMAAAAAQTAANIANIRAVRAPAFAAGGIAGRSGAEFIQVGERGPEAVLPANLTNLLLDAAAGGATNNAMNVSEGAVVVNVQGGDPAATREAVYGALQDLTDEMGRGSLFRG